MNILVVEDDADLCVEIVEYLERRNHQVSGCGTMAVARQALAAMAAKAELDGVVCDVGLPDGDGFELLEKLRAETDVPVVMLTARGELDDRIRGLDLGADDYIAKPFHFAELLARVRAHLRRRRPQQDVLSVADVRLDPRTREVGRGDRRLELTGREYELLELFLRHPGEVLSKESILDRLWGYAFDDNLVEVYVGYLRRKLGEPPLIDTLRGAGYRFREPAA